MRMAIFVMSVGYLEGGLQEIIAWFGGLFDTSSELLLGYDGFFELSFTQIYHAVQ